MKNKNSASKRSLISKTMRLLTLCIMVCFFLTAPLFYLLTKGFYAEDMIDIIESVKEGHGIPPLDLEQDIMAGMMLQFVLIFLVLALASFITMRFITKRLWQPFDDTLQKAEHFNLAQGAIPQFCNTDINEFARLNNSLKKLIQKDSETYRIQKEFTENASHELQTPLAIIRTKLDLLMQEDLTEKQARLVAELYDMTTRMNHLNRNLLLLAKIENDQYSTMEEVDVAAIITSALPLYKVLCNDSSLRLEDHRSKTNHSINANPILLECLLKNLIVNAIRHSVSGGVVRIVVDDERLTVSNTDGEGKPLDASLMFNRFHTGDASQKGNGLGLAIVKAICDFHQWQIEYRYEDGCHTFCVHFAPSRN